MKKYVVFNNDTNQTFTNYYDAARHAQPPWDTARLAARLRDANAGDIIFVDDQISIIVLSGEVHDYRT